MKGNSFYTKVNNIAGWLMFGIALVVYTLTMEKSGSFWDCGEFIPVAAKLEIAHPPGAPFFSIVGRIFSLVATSGTAQVAVMINFVSALSTAFVSLFCFWIITAIGKKILIRKEEDYTTSNVLALMASGFVGALASTFADSIWFSAVEGEVYALSIFFMTFVVWAAMKWEADDSERADRWLVLIAFMIGLSTGVHLLSLLALPFIGIIYFYKKMKFSWLGLAAAFALSFVLVVFVMQGVIVGIPAVLAQFELLFVNSFGMGFNSGVFFGMFFILAVLVGAIYLTQVKNKYYANLALVSFLVLLIGYSCYMVVPIRAMANPPINMNKPTDVFSMLSYLKREQYGSRPLLNGPDYTAEMRMVDQGGDIAVLKEGGTIWIKDDASGRYINGGKKQEYEYAKDAMMFFPRLGIVGDNGKTAAYRAWLNPWYGVYDREKRKVLTKFEPNQLQSAEQYVKQLNSENESSFGANRYKVKDILTQNDNLKFFFQYQLGYMYMRYFMWNFSGRQNDIQGTYANSEGGWIVGIDAVDDWIGTTWGNPEWRQTDLSPVRAANYANNRFYGIPFILGLIGLVFVFMYDWKIGIAIGVLFFSTGLIFNIYGNHPPIEPRERDYVIAGSLFAYSFFIGLSVLAIYKLLKDKITPQIALGFAFSIALVGPLLMGFEGWNDHDRSDRSTAADFATNYLESCEPNAIIFTQGDNDTYPLWYAQEIEGIRTDIRVINLSLLGVDWYINQLRYKMNDADPVKLTFLPSMLSGGQRDMVQYVQNPKLDPNKFYDAQEIMKFIAKDDPQFEAQYRIPYYLPARKLNFPINEEMARSINLISAGDTTFLSDITLDLQKGSLYKYDLLTLDIVANNINERPIYFAVSVSPSSFMGFEKYFQQEGLTYRIVPKINPSGQPTSAPVNTEQMYDNVMNKFKWGQLDTNPKAYVDENIGRMTLNLVNNFVRLGEQLLIEGDKQKAIEVMDRCLQVLPENKVPFNFFHSEIPGIYLAAGDETKAIELSDRIIASAKAELDYYVLVYNDKVAALGPGDQQIKAQYAAGAFTQNRDVMEQLYLLQQMLGSFKRNGLSDYATEIETVLNEYTEKLKKV